MSRHLVAERKSTGPVGDTIWRYVEMSGGLETGRGCRIVKVPALYAGTRRALYRLEIAGHRERGFEDKAHALKKARQWFRDNPPS